MSSYLTFYGVPKDKELKPMVLTSYSRSSELYQVFQDVINPIYCGDDKYTDLTLDDIYQVERELHDDITRARKRIEEYEKYVKTNPDFFEEILMWKEVIEDKEYVISTLIFLKDIISDCKYSTNSFEKIVCNVD